MAEEEPASERAGLGASSTAGLGSGTGGGIGFAPAGGGIGFAPAGGGIGFAPAGGGIGFAPARAGLGAQPMETEEAPEEDNLLPTAFGQRMMQAAEERRKKQEQAQQSSKAQKKVSDQASKQGADIGKFEAHTKGFGLKMLEKFGYKKGMGLGQGGGGMVKPLEVIQFGKSEGLGFKTKTIAAAKKEEEERQKEAEARASAAAGPAPGLFPSAAPAPGPQQLWKKRNAVKREKREYKTATQLLDEQDKSAATAGTPFAAAPIIDMRGKQARVVTNLEHVNAQQLDEEADDVPMPELQHNLRLIVDLAEAEITTADRKLRQERETAIILLREEERLAADREEQHEQLERIERLLNSVAACEARAAAMGGDAAGSLGELARMYLSMQKEFPAEYVAHGLNAVALSHARPLVVAAMAEWAPLASPRRFAPELRMWRPLLESASAGDAIFEEAQAADPYTRLLEETFMARVRSDITNRWQPRDPESLLALFEAWDAALPPWVRERVLRHLVLPKLTSAVEEWDPLREQVPIHQWMHPWLPLLGDHLKPVYAPIRHKLASCLRAWHYEDDTARIVLSPWRGVFGEREWEDLLRRCILPQLTLALQQLVINPAQQQLLPFQRVMAWEKELQPPHLLFALLEAHFFPKWHHTLQTWLLADPNFEEVSAWYLGWKNLFSADLQAHERMRRHFTAALDMMNQALSGAAPQLPIFATAPPPQQPPPPAAAPAREYNPYATQQLSLRELLERFAEEHGVLLMPRPGVMHDGLQVLAFGSVSVVVDPVHELLRARTPQGWTAVGFDQLLHMQPRR